MKKKLSFLFINFVIIIFVVVLVELIATYCIPKNKFQGYKYFSQMPTYRYFSKEEFRQPYIFDKKLQNSDIIIAGCSYAYGLGLNYDETFAGKLSKYFKKNVYDIGILGGSPREILYMLMNNDIINEITTNTPNNVKYFIYLFMSDHLARLYYNNRPRVPIFVAQNNYSTLKYIELPFFIANSNLLNYIRAFLFEINFYKNSGNLFELYIKEISKMVKNRYNNAKFIVLDYNGCFPEMDDITVINVRDIVNIDLDTVKYQLSDTDNHPNSDAWEIIVPKFIERLEQINNL